MVKVKKFVVNVKEGTEEYKEETFVPMAPVEEPESVDIKKLKQILLNKGIIADKTEVE